MDTGRISSAALMLSGLAGVAMPGRVAAALDLVPGSGRGITETRAGLGATYAGLGAFALVRGSADAHRAVGFTWLGAGASRLASYGADRPRTDAIYWLSLGMELGLGAAALAAARRSVRPRA
ncbi:MAG: hypothetical protein J7518_11995 [Nocardioidaceae bacterium]|nr:hypothetical protein [Nocardioidaceae bacterium]